MIHHKERILFLYLSTGGGHVAAAKALAAECVRRYSPDDVEVHLLDGIPKGAKLTRKLVEDGYRFATQTLPFIWTILYQLVSIPLLMIHNTFIMVLSATPGVRRYIRKHRITRIVSLHFLMNAPLFRALRQLRQFDMPAVTVITDPYTCHPIWFFHQFTPIVVFSKQVYKRAKQHLVWLGIPRPLLPRRQEVVIFPPILHSKFDHALNKEDSLLLKDRYGFSRHKRLILITGGGEGLLGGDYCLRALARAGLDVEVAFVCGRNIDQFKRASKIAKDFPSVSIRVYGFVDFMYELMNMADIILTKAGPATIFEALMLRKPLIITQRTYGQEQGNVDFIVKNKLGWFITRPQLIMRKIRELFDNPDLFNQTIHNIVQKNISNGTSQIMDYIMELPLKPEIKTDSHPM